MSALFDVEPEPQEAELPSIQGTPAQYEWATSVRDGKIRACRKRIREWQCYIQRLREAGRDDAAGREMDGLEHAIEVMERLEREPSARFWLGRRDNTAAELLAEADPKRGNTYHRRDVA